MVAYHRIGKAIPKWDPTWIKEGEIQRAREINEATAKRRQSEYEESAEYQDKHLAKMEQNRQQALQTRTQSYALPGHQGKLGEIGGDLVEPPPKPVEKPIAEHSEAEKAVRVSEIAKHLGIPMQPGRQIAAWSNRQTLPKAEGSQGTLFAPRKYRTT